MSKVLAGFKKLQRLELSGTKLSDEAVKELRKALPRCTVVK